jgi:hypothetical protein
MYGFSTVGEEEFFASSVNVFGPQILTGSGAEMRRVRHGWVALIPVATGSRPSATTSVGYRAPCSAVLVKLFFVIGVDSDSFFGGEVHLMDPESALKALPRALGVKGRDAARGEYSDCRGFVLYVLFARGTFEHTQRL